MRSWIDHGKAPFTPIEQTLTRWEAELLFPDCPAIVAVPGRTTEEVSALLSAYARSRVSCMRPTGVLIGPEKNPSGWIDEGPSRNLARRVEAHSGMLRELAGVDNLIVEEPPRSLLDASENIVADAHSLLWEGRFLLKEGHPEADSFFAAVGRWTLSLPLSAEDRRWLDTADVRRRKVRDWERLDITCLYTTLAAQNDLLSRMVLMLDGLDVAVVSGNTEALRQLSMALDSIAHWNKAVGCPIGLILGFPDDISLERLKSLSPSLHHHVKRGLAWGHSVSGD